MARTVHRQRAMNQLTSVASGFLFGIGLILAAAVMRLLFHLSL